MLLDNCYTTESSKYPGITNYSVVLSPKMAITSWYWAPVNNATPLPRTKICQEIQILRDHATSHNRISSSISSPLRNHSCQQTTFTLQRQAINSQVKLTLTQYYSRRLHARILSEVERFSVASWVVAAACHADAPPPIQR